MVESVLTAKGQTTVPAQVRAALGFAPGTRLVWHVVADGSILVRAKTKSVLDLAGMLQAPAAKPVAVQDMNAWRD